MVLTTTQISDEPKAARPRVTASHRDMLEALPFNDMADFDDAARGFPGTVEPVRA